MTDADELSEALRDLARALRELADAPLTGMLPPEYNRERALHVAGVAGAVSLLAEGNGRLELAEIEAATRAVRTILDNCAQATAEVAARIAAREANP